MTFSLAGYPIQKLRLYVPIDGVATAEVELISAASLSGAAVLVVGDLTLAGVVTGAVVDGVGRYAWTAGAGLWETSVASKGYQSALGVLRSNVLTDLPIGIAAATGGPTEAMSIGLPDVRLGGVNSAYVRPAGPAWNVLRALRVPWWVDGAGVTQIRPRPSAPAPLATVDLLRRDPEDGGWEVAPREQTYAPWMPGNTIGNDLITSMLLEAAGGPPVRLSLATRANGAPSKDIKTGFDDLIDQRTDKFRFHGIYEYRVTTAGRDTAGLIPVSTSIGLPALAEREIRAGIPGFSAQLTPGMVVSVGFENGDPALPYIRGFEPRGRAVPVEMQLDATVSVKLGDGVSLVARQGDPVTGVSIVSAIDPMTKSGPLTFTDANGVTLVLTFTGGIVTTVVSGPPLTGYKVGLPGQTKVRA